MASIYDWSTTEASNATADSEINWAEGQDPGTVNNSAREMMRKLAVFRQMVSGELTTTGTTAAYVLTFNHAPSAYIQGFYVVFKAHLTCVADATLNVNSLGPVAMCYPDGSNVLAGDLQAAGFYMATYDTTLSKFVLLNAQQGMQLSATELKLGDGVAASAYRIGRASVSDGSIVLGGGPAAATGSNITLYGSTHATAAFDIVFEADGTDRLKFDYSVPAWDFSSQNVQGINNLAATGDLTLTGAVISPNDTGSLAFHGGNAALVGGGVTLYGQSHATRANDIAFLADSVEVGGWDNSGANWDWAANNFTNVGDFAANGAINFDTGPVTVATGNLIVSVGNFTVTAGDLDVTAGQITVGANAVEIFSTKNAATGPDISFGGSVGLLSCPGEISLNINDDGGTASLRVRTGGETSAANVIWTLTSAGNIVMSNNIYREDNTGILTIAGGSGASSGGNIDLYGGSHATDAGDIGFNSGGTEVLLWDESEAVWNFKGSELKNVALVDLNVYTVATLPSVTGRTGAVAYVSDGDSGSPCLAVVSNSNWKRIPIGSNVSAT